MENDKMGIHRSLKLIPVNERKEKKISRQVKSLKPEVVRGPVAVGGRRP